jgi:hypothetical protein
MSLLVAEDREEREINRNERRAAREESDADWRRARAFLFNGQLPERSTT